MIGIDQSQQCLAHGSTVGVQAGTLLFDRGYMVRVEGVVGLWGCLGSLSGVSQVALPSVCLSTLQGPGGPAILSPTRPLVNHRSQANEGLCLASDRVAWHLGQRGVHAVHDHVTHV